MSEYEKPLLADREREKVEFIIDTSLPMSDAKQRAIIGHMLLVPKFFGQAIRKLKPSYFLATEAKIIFEWMQDFYEKIKKPPTYHDMLGLKALSLEADSKQALIKFYLKDSADKARDYRLITLTPSITEWLHSKILQDTVTRATFYWNNERYQDAAILMTEAIRACRDSKFEDGEQMDFEHFDHYLNRNREERKEALTTGCNLLDEALLGVPPEGCLAGGLQKGDTTVILAPVNIGKTTTMITIAVANIMLDQSVLFVTHEGRPDDIRIKFLKAMLAVNENKLFEMFGTHDGRLAIAAASERLTKFLVYVPFNKANMKVEDVIPIIDRMQEERCLKTSKGFDLFVSDYPAKLSTELASKGHMQPRLVLDHVYENFVQMALEKKWHSVVAIQVNRAGSRINSGEDDSHRLLQMEDVSEAFGPMMSATNVITLNRSSEAKRDCKMTFYVAKSRSSETGAAIIVRTAFDAALSHSNQMGACGYYGTSVRTEPIQFLLEQFKDKWIPQTGKSFRPT